MKSVARIEGELMVDREAHEPTSIKIGEVDLITLLEAYSGQEVEIQIRLLVEESAKTA